MGGGRSKEWSFKQVAMKWGSTVAGRSNEWLFKQVTMKWGSTVAVQTSGREEGFYCTVETIAQSNS